MCREINPKSRKLFSLASASLALGLVLPMLLHPSGQSSRNLLHFVCGLLIGMSLSINLGLVWKNARQRRLGSAPRL
jgi:hypothetical protein